MREAANTIETSSPTPPFSPTRKYPPVKRLKAYAPSGAQPGFGDNPPRCRKIRDIEGDGKQEVLVELKLDRLQWLLDHRAIEMHQFAAGRRLQEDWEKAKMESRTTIELGTRVNASPRNQSISEAKLAAGLRLGKALAVLPPEIEGIATLFLLPEDHSFSLERCAALVRMDRKAARLSIRVALSLLSRHYGYG